MPAPAEAPGGPALTLLRDGMGHEPLPYAIRPDGLVLFSTWIHCLRAVPGLEHACGLCLRGRCLQVVLRAYEQRLHDDGDGQGAEYRISEWHSDGCSEERIVATATCYLVVDDDLDGGTLIVRDDHDVAHYLPATGGSVVLVLARCRDVEFKAPKKRHSVVLRCRYDRRRADVDVEDEDSESDEEAGSAESRAASLAAKLRARATAGGESGGTWGANGFEPDGRAVDPSSVGFTGDEREVDLV